MARYDYSGSYPPSPADWDKMQRANRQAHEGADFDTGWITTPASKVIRHDLGVPPSEVYVYTSSSKTGETFASDTFTQCDRTNITITGPGLYCRVRLQAGSI